MEEKLITQRYKSRQLLLLVFCGFLFLICLFFLFFEFSTTILYLVIGMSIASTLLNIIFARVNEIKISIEGIIIENIWHKHNYPKSKLKDIRLVRFFMPYPFNPYLKFELENEETFIALIPNPIIKYLSKGGVNKYIDDLKSILRA